MNLTASPPSAYVTLPAVIRALMGAAGVWGGRGWLSTALALLLYGRLSGICRRMERLIARYQAGRLWRTASRVAGRAGDVVARPLGTRLWPGRFGWLVRLASYHAVGYGSQLRAVLAEPEMVALLLDAPQVRRILLPLCRALGVETSVLLLPPRVRGRAARPVLDVGGVVGGASLTHPTKLLDVPRKPKLMDWGRIPLPSGVLAAARRQGFRKGG